MLTCASRALEEHHLQQCALDTGLACADDRPKPCRRRRLASYCDTSSVKVKLVNSCSRYPGSEFAKLCMVLLSHCVISHQGCLLRLRNSPDVQQKSSHVPTCTSLGKRNVPSPRASSWLCTASHQSRPNWQNGIMRVHVRESLYLYDCRTFPILRHAEHIESRT